MNLHLTVAEAKYWYVKRPAHKLFLWFIWKLPRKVVMWSAYRVGAHATTGRWGSEETPALLFMDAMQRWDQPNDGKLRSVPTA
jgi:hypothetical protein